LSAGRLDFTPLIVDTYRAENIIITNTKIIKYKHAVGVIVIIKIMLDD